MLTALIGTVRPGETTFPDEVTICQVALLLNWPLRVYAVVPSASAI